MSSAAQREPTKGNDRKRNFHGLIQHSFALQIHKAHAPFRGLTNLDRISERFRPAAAEGERQFDVEVAGAEATGESATRITSHSPLLEREETTVRMRELNQLESVAGHDWGHLGEFPHALSWALGKTSTPRGKYREPRLILAERLGEGDRISCNDFLITRRGSTGVECDAVSISRALIELIAHKRSQLFGLSLGNRFVNAMLPHAILIPRESNGGAWLLQPLVTFIRGASKARDFRSTYSLSIFLVPIKKKQQALRKRGMSLHELQSMVGAGWSLATAPPATAPPATAPPSFELCGALPDYMNRLARTDLESSLTLRQVVEEVAFGVSLRVAEGSGNRATAETRRRVGDDIVTALGSARVSSVVVVDKKLKKQQVMGSRPAPGGFGALLKSVSADSHVPSKWTGAERKKYRLHRPFVDGDEAVVGVLPHSRCMVVASAKDAQWGRLESALMQAGSVAYMTLGAANAVGTLRAIDRDLEKMEGASPREIAAIDSEIATDLNEIYDLDITRESYRRLYRRLRKRLGITSDYKTLQDKMEALYRVTSTVHVERTNKLLIWLTVVILIFTVLAVVKPGG